jgi:hypothetical protein
MKPMAMTGILLIVLGVLALIYQSISYTKQEQILEVGPIEATKETQETIPLPPVLGAVAVLGGAAMLAGGMRKQAQIVAKVPFEKRRQR